MATTTAITQRIEASLREIEAETNFLPELLAGWVEESPADREVWYLEWRELLARFEGLAHAYHAGAMTIEQQQRHRALREELRDAIPLLERLGIAAPPIVQGE